MGSTTAVEKSVSYSWPGTCIGYYIITKSNYCAVFLTCLFLESHPDHLKVWNVVKDHFLLQVLDQALNTIPESEGVQ